RAGMTAPLAITMGEPAGVGPDIVLALYARRTELALPPFVVFGDAPFLASRARRLGLALDIAQSTPQAATALFPTALPVVPVAGPVPDQPGRTTPQTAPAVIGAITGAVASVQAGACRAMVTAPI